MALTSAQKTKYSVVGTALALIAAGVAIVWTRQQPYIENCSNSW